MLEGLEQRVRHSKLLRRAARLPGELAAVPTRGTAAATVSMAKVGIHADVTSLQRRGSPWTMPFALPTFNFEHCLTDMLLARLLVVGLILLISKPVLIFKYPTKAPRWDYVVCDSSDVVPGGGTSSVDDVA